MSKKIKQILQGYIQNIAENEDVDSFYMTFGDKDDLDIVSTLTPESTNVLTAIENGLLDEDELAVIKEICDAAFKRENHPLIRMN